VLHHAYEKLFLGQKIPKGSKKLHKKFFSVSNGSSRLSIDGLGTDGNRSRSGSTSSTSPRQSAVQKHPIPLKNRQLIQVSKVISSLISFSFQSCFNNPHEVLGKKIIKRTAEKRADFRSFYSTLSADEKECVENGIKLLLKKAVVNIDFLDEVTSNSIAQINAFTFRLNDYPKNLGNDMCNTELVDSKPIISLL
jgi:hypothetical protein